MTEPKRPLKVFLCHAHADRDPVRALYTRLTKDGVDAWLDKAKLLPGQDWELEIRKAVREADVVVVCLSKQFNQAGFRQKEVRLALDTAMEKPEGEIFIIPARLEECDTLESLRKWHWVDLFENGGYEMLMRALRTRADKIGVTLRIKKSRVPKKSNQEKRVFYDLTAHYEYDFENTTPEILANFLFETLTRIMRTVPGVDKSDNSRTAEYQTSQVEYLDPKDGKTTQHALIVRGRKVQILDKGDYQYQGVKPLADVSEMLIITVTQGVNRSRLRFDSNELPNDAFESLVEWILADIGKTVTVQVKDDTVGNVSPPKQEQPEIKIPEKQGESKLEEKPIAASKPKVVSPEPKKAKSSRKLNAAIVVALIALVGTICAALISLPLIEKMFSPTSEPPTTTPDYFVTPVTLVWTDTPNADLTGTVAAAYTQASRFPTITATPTSLPTEIIDTKGVSMVFVPTGEFTMGVDARVFCQENDHPNCLSWEFINAPAHTVYLDAYYIDKYEVTNKLYKDCVDAQVCKLPKEVRSYTRSSYYGNVQYDNYPVIYVDWNRAMTYCEWREAKLPTEAQWEKAARGIDGRTYSWGESLDCDKANYSNCVGDTVEVGTYESGVSPYGLYDMTGNVWEWVYDWYSTSYYQDSPLINPLGPDSGGYTRVVRGGGWSHNVDLYGRWQAPSYFLIYTGFRCAKDANP